MVKLILREKVTSEASLPTAMASQTLPPKPNQPPEEPKPEARVIVRHEWLDDDNYFIRAYPLTIRLTMTKDDVKYELKNELTTSIKYNGSESSLNKATIKAIDHQEIVKKFPRQREAIEKELKLDRSEK